MCKVCVSQRQKESYKKHKEKRWAYRKVWIADKKDRAKQYSATFANKNIEKIASYQDDYKAKHKISLAIKAREYRHGLGKGEFLNMLEQQNNSCQICSISLIDDNGVKKIASVDHDHITKKIRGILCNPCNLVLGWAQDDPRVLIKAASYLKEQGHYGQTMPKLQDQG